MNILKSMLLFATGGGIGYGIACYICKAKYEAKLSEELSDMEDYYVARHPDKKPRENGYATEKKIDESNTEYVKPEPRDYTKYYEETDKPADPAETESPADDDADDYYEGLELEKEKMENKGKKPKQIKASDFGSEPNYGTLSLLYYTENEILTIHDEEDESEDIIYLDEIADFIGDALDKFDFRHNDQEVIYVRNFSRCTDFEITKVYGSFEG